MNNNNKILIVEDDKDTTFLLEMLLTKNNYNVVKSKNGEDALEILKKESPQVIIADWTMPVMDGLELCKALKQNEEHKIIYFIMLTARASLKDRITELDVGADDFIVKPIENQEFLARIRSGVRIYNLQNELRKIEHQKAVLQMACTIGHKINNPLGSLIMSFENLKDELKKPEQKKFADEFLIIEKAIERIKSLSKDLVHLQNPEVINYTSTHKMIKISDK
ncbi:MAG: response regulator [Ignavibacteriaceae bacterium]